MPDLPLSAHVLILHGREKLTIGTALIELGSPGRPRRTPLRTPTLSSAVRANALDSEALFIAIVRTFLVGVAIGNA